MKFLAVLALAAAAAAAPVSECKEAASKAEVACMRACGWGWRCTTGCALSKVDDFIKCELDEQDAIANTTAAVSARAADEDCAARVARDEVACIQGCDGNGLCTARCSITRVKEYLKCAGI